MSQKNIKPVISRLLETVFLPKYAEKNIICGFSILTHEQRDDLASLYDNKYAVKFYFIGGPNSRFWPRTQSVRSLYGDIMNEAQDLILKVIGEHVVIYHTTVSSCEEYERVIKNRETISESKKHEEQELIKKGNSKMELNISKMLEKKAIESEVSDNFYGVAVDIYNSDYGKMCHLTYLMKNSFTEKESNIIHDISKEGKKLIQTIFGDHFKGGVQSSNSTVDVYLRYKDFYNEKKN